MGTSNQTCPTCGARVRVAGRTTMRYEPVDLVNAQSESDWVTLSDCELACLRSEAAGGWGKCSQREFAGYLLLYGPAFVRVRRKQNET